MIDKVGLQWTFRILGASILVTGIPCAFLLTELRRGGTTPRFDWSQMKSMPFLTLTMSGAVGVFALFVPSLFLPIFARSIGLSASTGAGLVAAFGASTAVGRLFGAIWPVSSSLPPLFAFAIINGCANGSFFVALPTAVAALAPGSAAASIGLMTSFWTPGYLMGASEASSIESYRAAIFYAAGVGSASTFLIVVSRLMLSDAAPSPMELPWLQSLNLLLTRITGTCYQTSDWRKSVVDEAKHTLLCLAGRRQLTGGRRVVTNEHLTRALYYFDVRMLLADVDDNHAGLPREDFFRDFYTDCTSNGAPSSSDPTSNKRPGATSLTPPKPKTDTQNAAPSATATPTGTKRNASDDLRGRLDMIGARVRQEREFRDRNLGVREREARESRTGDPRGMRARDHKEIG
ncbi:monocarboxylate transporter [Fusarium agapanthi]|uniref:Monocarboxylate transporter n=1 Tax=Fusarium agapanthi TaxID=1803897 RepID=A0A9P5BEP9_9HYPO|nr:monocarboxylate transporter [Fusarium agapanthi]